jgi:hypothetical protein
VGKEREGREEGKGGRRIQLCEYLCGSWRSIEGREDSQKHQCARLGFNESRRKDKERSPFSDSVCLSVTMYVCM